MLFAPSPLPGASRSCRCSAFSPAPAFWPPCSGRGPTSPKCSPRRPVLFKFLVALSLAGAAGVVALRFAKPDAKPSFGAALAVPLLLLTMGIAAELAISPAASWRPLLVGQNAGVCLVLIPLFSLPPLLAALTGLRHGAPSRPRLAGAAAGLFAGGLGAALWAMHCTDDSPLFVAAWYAPAVAIVAFAGAALGVRMLRW
jgi:hypothetical protein